MEIGATHKTVLGLLEFFREQSLDLADLQVEQVVGAHAQYLYIKVSVIAYSGRDLSFDFLIENFRKEFYFPKIKTVTIVPQPEQRYGSVGQLITIEFTTPSGLTRRSKT